MFCASIVVCEHMLTSGGITFLSLAGVMGKEIETERDMVILLHARIIIAIKFNMPDTCSHSKIQVGRRSCELRRVEEENPLSLAHT